MKATILQGLIVLIMVGAIAFILHGKFSKKTDIVDNGNSDEATCVASAKKLTELSKSSRSVPAFKQCDCSQIECQTSMKKMLRQSEHVEGVLMMGKWDQDNKEFVNNLYKALNIIKEDEKKEIKACEEKSKDLSKHWNLIDGCSLLSSSVKDLSCKYKGDRDLMEVFTYKCQDLNIRLKGKDLKNDPEAQKARLEVQQFNSKMASERKSANKSEEKRKADCDKKPSKDLNSLFAGDTLACPLIQQNTAYMLNCETVAAQAVYSKAIERCATFKKAVEMIGAPELLQPATQKK